MTVFQTDCVAPLVYPSMTASPETQYHLGVRIQECALVYCKTRNHSFLLKTTPPPRDEGHEMCTKWDTLFHLFFIHKGWAAFDSLAFVPTSMKCEPSPSLWTSLMGTLLCDCSCSEGGPPCPTLWDHMGLPTPQDR